LFRETLWVSEDKDLGGHPSVTLLSVQTPPILCQRNKDLGRQTYDAFLYPGEVRKQAVEGKYTNVHNPPLATRATIIFVLPPEALSVSNKGQILPSNNDCSLFSIEEVDMELDTIRIITPRVDSLTS
jgi:hypothetical protein